MNQENKSDKSVKVVTDTREEEILGLFRLLHGKVLIALQECDIKPTFNDKFGECGAEDYKNLHTQSRILLSAKRKDRNDTRVAGIRTAIVSVVDTHMEEARARKAKYDAIPAEHREFLAAFPNVVKIPLGKIRACFPKDATDKQVWDDLSYMGYKVTDLSDKGVVVVAFVPSPTKEEVPASGEQPASKAA